MRVGHSVVIGPRCGLYSSTRTLVEAERAAGIDAWLVPVMGFSDAEIDGIPCSLKLEECNVLVSHSGMSRDQATSGIPIVHVLHAQPRYKMKSEAHHCGAAPFYSVLGRLKEECTASAFVTFYPEHLPYWELALPHKPVHVIPPPVDLNRWTPDGPSDYDFGGLGGEFNVVAPDTWRVTQDPFDLIHAFAFFAKEHSGAKLHLYGIGDHLLRCDSTWNGVFGILREMGALGETMSWSYNMGNIYRSADIVLSNQVSANNVMREALACGCPVVAAQGCVHTPWTAPLNDPIAYAVAIEELYEELQTDAGEVLRQSRCYAEENFAAEKSGAALVEILTDLADGSSATIYSPVRKWYEDGLCFECLPGCAYCCGCGGVVRVNKKEIDAIGQYLGEDVSSRFVQTATGWQVAHTDDGVCQFATVSGCSIEEGKPVQCKTFPFWLERMESRAAWNETAKWCPGINKGPLHTQGEIEQCMHDYSIMQLEALGERAPKETFE